MKHIASVIAFTLCITGLVGCSDTPETRSHVGYVESEWRYIASPGSGWLVSRPAQEGVTVAVGALLFELDNDQELVAVREAGGRIEQAVAEAENLATGARPAEISVLKARVAEAEARLKQTKSERDRVLPLVKRGLEPDSSRDQVLANYDIAFAALNVAKENIKVAELAARDAQRAAATAQTTTAEAVRASAEVRLAKRSVFAAISGTVTEVFRYPGEFVTMGTPVLAIQPADSLKVRFFVSQSELTQFALGMTINAHADGMTTPVKAVVSYIATEAEFTPPVIYSKNVRDKLVFMIEARLPENSRLLPGLAVDNEHRIRY